MTCAPVRWNLRGVSIVLAIGCGVAASVPLGARADAPLDRIFAAYAAGDVAIVARSFATPSDFQPLRLTTPEVLDKWLGDWQPTKAAFVIELAAAANLVSPAKTWPIVSAGRRYVTNRRGAPPASADDDPFESTWHRAAIGLLQRHALATFEEDYLDALEARLKSAAAPGLARDRLLLSRAIAQEQRCWNDRPDLDRAGAAADDIARAAGAAVTSTSGVAKPELVAERARRRACLTDAVARFDAAAGSGDGGAEARVRGAWMRFQLGQFQDAFRAIDGVEIRDDRELVYWAALIRGRIAGVLGRDAEAERAYRTALAAFPDAQSAGIGLALTLFKRSRPGEADAAALAVRTRAGAAPDPWWRYNEADHRFVERWIGMLRGARQ